MKIYLAGPMRGLPNYNLPAFDEARERLTKEGHLVFCPAQLVRAVPYPDQYTTDGDRPFLQHVISLDIACLFAAEAIALLPGWETSRGVSVELALAQFLGLAVYDATTMTRIYPVMKPWKLVASYEPDALR